MTICFSVLVPESLNVTILTSVLLPGANYLDIRKGVFLITKNVHTLEIWKSIHRREYVFCSCPRNCWNVEKNKLPVVMSKEYPFSKSYFHLFDLFKILTMMGQRHCSQRPNCAGAGWVECCAGALDTACIDTTLVPRFYNWTTGKFPGL